MTIEKQIAAIEREIFWNDQVSRKTKNKTQRNRCIDRIEKFHEELWELKCKLGEMDIERGSIEHRAWYDLSVG
jgi:hypothetical protein